MRLRIVISLLFFAAVTGFCFWKSRTFFLQNHVTFLINQKEYPEAITIVDRLLKDEPENLKNQYLNIKALVVSGQQKKALGIPVSEALEHAQPETNYWIALASYNIGEESQALRNAQKFQSSRFRMRSNASMYLAALLAGASMRDRETDLNSDTFLMMLPVEQAVYLSFSAVENMNLNRLDIATEQFKKALILGMHSPVMLGQAVKTSSLSGDFQAADMFLAMTTPSMAEQLFNELRDIDSNSSQSITVDAYKNYGSGSRQNRAQALAWIADGYVKGSDNRIVEVLDTLANLKADFPFDNAIRFHSARVYETLGETTQALNMYKIVHSEEPSLTTALRIWALQGDSPQQVSNKLASTLKNMEHVKVVAGRPIGDDFDPPDNVLQPGNIFEQNVAVEEAGVYTVTVIARTKSDVGMGSFLQTKIADDMVFLNYIRGMEWTCYSNDIRLERGSFLLQFSNESMENVSSPLEIKAICIGMLVSSQ